jgi:hypothetical protein
VVVLPTPKAKVRERRAFERLEVEQILSSYRADDLAVIGGFLGRVRAIVDQIGRRADKRTNAPRQGLR